MFRARFFCLFYSINIFLKVYTQSNFRTTNVTPMKYKDLLGYNASKPRVVHPDHDFSAGDQYGHAIALWQNYALISATGENAADSSGKINGGMVFQFVQENGEWKQQNAVLTSGTLSDAYGESIAMSDGIAIVGAWKDSSFGTFSGKAYVYKLSRSGTGVSVFLENQVLTMENAAAGDFFGFSVAIVPQSDQYMKGAAIVGAFGFNKDNNIVDSGAVAVFAHIGDSWIQVALLQASDGASFDSFGWSIAAHDKAIVVGAPEAGGDNTKGGAAYVYTFDSEVISGRRHLQGNDAEHRSQDDQERQQHEEENQRRQEEHLQSSNYLSWQYNEVIKLTSTSTGSANSMFGVDVAVRNESDVLTIAVGACLDNFKGYHAGAVFIFSRTKHADLVKKYVAADNKNQKQGGNQKRSLYAVGENSDLSGSLGDLVDGRRLQAEGDLEGQQQRDQQQKEQQQQQQNGRWEIVANDLLLDKSGQYWVREASLFGSTDLMRFGRSLALSGGALIIGADMSGLSAGQAFVFARKQSSLAISSSSIKSGTLHNSTWVRAAKLKNAYGTVGDFFGASCDVYGGFAIIGAYMNSASDAKLRSNTRSDSQMMFPGAAYAYFADDSQWKMSSSEAMNLLSASTFMASVALTLALLVVIVSGMLVYRGLVSQKERGYLHTNTMDSTGSTKTNGIDVSNRSTGGLQPSRGGSSGLHLSSFRKKRNKVSSLSAPSGGAAPPGSTSIGGVAVAGTDPYHSPNLLEEHGLGQPSTAQSRFAPIAGYKPKPYPSAPTPSYFPSAGEPITNPAISRGALGQGGARHIPPPMTSTLESNRKSTLTRKAAGGAIELSPPTDF